MSVINMAKDIKKVHPDFLICYKVGAFMQVFGKDAYIISYIFGYSIKKAKGDIATCGFPKQIMPRICARLEQRKLNYMVIDTRNNYDVDEKFDNKNLNQYNKIFVKAYKYIKIKKRILHLEEALLDKIDKEDVIKKIEKIEEIVYENRKI